jgi:tetratricopeptide (TPR) repeat protein/transglutaminase-like putative cysteine protease
MGLRSGLSGRLSIFIILLALVIPGVAQSSATNSITPPQAAPSRPDYLKEALVLESNRTKVTYQEDGSDTREQISVIHVLSQAGVQQLAVLTFPYTSANETIEFDYVRVRKPDGTVVTTPEYNIQDMPSDVTRGAPMYSDLHEKHVTVKALGIGDTLEYLVRYRNVKPQVPGQFWLAYTFSTVAIVKDEELEVNVPKNKYVKVASPVRSPQTKEEGDRRIYIWKSTNLERKDADEQAASPVAAKPSVQITTFRNWEEIGRWYGELQRSQVVVTPQIQAKAAELTKGLASDEDKIRAIYDFVSTYYHYVSLSFGIGRYQPHPAEDVLENEYGDCKDKHTLLAALLKAAGYDAWPALISATSKIDSDVPSPGQFDHVITVVPLGNSLTWMDTTPGVAPFGLLLSNLRDKQALVMPTGKPASLMTTPANPPFPSVQTFIADGKLSPEGTFTGHMQSIARGDVEVINRFVFRQYPAVQWKDVVQQVSYRWGFAGDVSEVTASNPEDTIKPFEFAYDYKREKIGDWDNHRITAPLPPTGLESASLQKKKPQEPAYLGALGTAVLKAKIELPSGFTPKVPDKVDLTEDFADFHASYAFKDGVLTATRTLIIKKNDVPLSEWDAYQKFSKAISDDHDSWIDLGGDTTSASSVSSNPEAHRLFEEGLNALRNRDQTRAEEDFDRLLQLDSKYPYAHANLGTVYLNERNVEGGIRELRKEEELHPDESYSYRVLAQALVYKHENREAIEQLQKLLVLDPKDRDAALNLGQLLSAEKRYAKALTVLQKAAEQAPDSATLQYQLGYAYIKNGEKNKGLAVLQKALSAKTDSSRSSDELNSVAYSLIEMDAGFDVAQHYAERALEEQEAASLKAGTGREGLHTTSSLGATWDTMGWLYYRLGKHDEALPYLRAAWTLTQNAEVGDHLGQLYVKLGKKREAAQIYRLAYSSAGQNIQMPNSPTILQSITEHYKDLMGKDAHPGAFTTTRRADGTFTQIPSEELSRMRMVKITTTSHPSAHGTVSIVFSPGKVEQVTLVDGDETLKSLIERIQATKFSVEFPDQKPTRLVRRGIMSCGSLGCDLALILPDDRSLLAVE